MDANKLIPYSHDSKVYRQSGSVPSNCNAITFINVGTDTCNVLGYDIAQGFQLYLPGNVGEIDTTNYTIKFAGITTNQQLLVITKMYN